MRELTDNEAVLAACGGHPLIAQLLPHRLTPGGWTSGGAVAVRHDYWGTPQTVVVGPPADAAQLVDALADVIAGQGISFPRVARPRVELRTPHPWGFAWQSASVGADPHSAEWLTPAAADELDAFLDEAFPSASTRPSSPHARRWGAIRADDGSLAACIVDATESPLVGFVASLAVAPGHRRRGHGETLLGWAVDQLLDERPTVGLWYDGDNTAAIAIYERLGFTMLPLTGAQLP